MLKIIVYNFFSIIKQCFIQFYRRRTTTTTYNNDDDDDDDNNRMVVQRPFTIKDGTSYRLFRLLSLSPFVRCVPWFRFRSCNSLWCFIYYGSCRLEEVFFGKTGGNVTRNTDLLRSLRSACKSAFLVCLATRPPASCAMHTKQTAKLRKHPSFVLGNIALSLGMLICGARFARLANQHSSYVSLLARGRKSINVYRQQITKFS